MSVILLVCLRPDHIAEKFGPIVIKGRYIAALHIADAPACSDYLPGATTRCPGFIDAHLHIESSTDAVFETATLPGLDDRPLHRHEIVNDGNANSRSGLPAVPINRQGKTSYY